MSAERNKTGCERFSRTALLIGEDSVEKLAGSKVAVFGVGGVGGYVCEALARSGVGSFVLVDRDVVSESNINRQIIATVDTVGRAKVDVMTERIHSINPDAKVEARNCFYLPDNAAEFDFSSYDYVVDCVDTVTAKLSIIERAMEAGVPVISAMGAGNKLDPTRFQVADISKTKVCPLARIMRKELKKRGIEHLKVVFSDEDPIPATAEGTDPGRRSTPGSIAFVPAAAGLVLASAVVEDLIK